MKNNISIVLEWFVAFPIVALQRGSSLSGMVIGWARLLGRRYHSTDRLSFPIMLTIKLRYLKYHKIYLLISVNT